MEVKLVPENKTFLFVVLGLIALLVVFQISRFASFEVPAQREDPDYVLMRSLVNREMNIRKRHVQLVKTSKEWEKRFLSGSFRDANLALLKKIELWAGISGLKYDSVQMPNEPGSVKQAFITLRGNSTYPTINRFLKSVENADFTVTVTAIRLKNESGIDGLRYELIISSPLLQKGGVTRE